MNFFMFCTRKRRSKRIRRRGWFFGLKKPSHSFKRKLKVIVFFLIFTPYYMWIRLFRLVWWSWPGKKTINKLTFVLWHIYFLICFIINLIKYWGELYLRLITILLYVYATIQSDELGYKDSCIIFQYIFGIIVLLKIVKKRIRARIRDIPWRMLDRYYIFYKWYKEFHYVRIYKQTKYKIKLLRYVPRDVKIERYRYRETIWGLFVLKFIFYGYVFYWFFCWYLAITVLEFLS